MDGGEKPWDCRQRSNMGHVGKLEEVDENNEGDRSAEKLDLCF